uniref:Cytochrome b n=1 Tax=Plasmodium gallinaceum TaxID=5849 RepID=CYB_PLAGA|nr:RecName: Full=Cytochrome b; AltName: Full=Complex III subunit 3; AltName: Full=Complex III subunit III; AltName: Full=Cytochrome b-c1 complex subunit 3; AltName: Full=Ubiquinol-cytochrome-c reductase complex cytochrome b subunit [Plasmodium gallinaceum]
MNYYSINLAKAHLLHYPCPLNINFLWNYGFLLGIVFFIQILKGVLLALVILQKLSYAYYSVQHILRAIMDGWCFRYMHATGASFVFILTYLHILRGLNYSYSYLPLSWISGLMIFLISIVTAFYGYVLPWGQMSFWNTTVITNLLYLFRTCFMDCGGYLVSDPTLKRFFVFIYFPFIALCQSLFGILPLSHPDNAITVDRYATPLHIVPEWYFLPFYAMLKTIPNKTAGLLVMLASLQILFLLAEQRNLTTLIHFKFAFGAREYSVPTICYMSSMLIWIGCQLPQILHFIWSFIYYIILF